MEQKPGYAFLTGRQRDICVIREIVMEIGLQRYSFIIHGGETVGNLQCFTLNLGIKGLWQLQVRLENTRVIVGYRRFQVRTRWIGNKRWRIGRQRHRL